ncbi:TonB-dependent receptor [Sphingopyxis sp. RIFCSPHIGHO2_12_FULL_65_19]|uniref:TonB-dependent receptor n=1 Tax=Sphingopyxis sp. RIFCSPHIGHO2_12_FULL_65_19 TaxID=1802172 RepID=UPI0008C799BF|nr:TonB-dependent receptor [Sphingopyxis sp. RIFCSPHIGHO2_12_FULL_65_19]OHD07846.1 MAG: TonB-dependent receptor [Sphingopyxis sp. RIFCSPHIGHO2_12_FULL_65_19]
MNSRNHARTLRAALLAGAGSTLLIAAMPAMAQDASTTAPQAEEDDAIVVTGIRETIQNSINTKREETAIVDALSSDDIGDIPAISVGQAIQTITGATTHREKGDASEIALRGLGPFLSNATFNGRDATNGSGDRSVNFNQFPSELVNNIKIYKTQQASLVEGGVAGTIEIGTLRPLDFGKRRLQGEVKAQYNPYGDRIVGSGGIGWRGTLSYVDQFANDTIGIAIGVQRNDTNNPEETYAASTTWTACQASPVVTNNNCNEYTRDEYGQNLPFYLVPNAYTFRQISETDKRDAVFGSIQWRPSDQFNINLDVQYSDRTFVESRRDLNLSEARRSLTNVVFDENGIVQSLSGQSAIESNGSELSRAEEYLGGGLSIEWQPSDRLTLTVDGSYSRTIRVEDERNVRLRTDPTDVNGVRTVFNNMRIPYTYEITPGSFVPTITIDPRFDLNNHDLFWDDARLRRDQSRRHNEIIAGRIDAGYEMDGFFSKLTAGARWSEMTFRDYDVRNGDFNLNPALAEDRRINNLCRNRAFPQTGFLSAADGNSINSWATFDVDCLFREYLGSEDPGAREDKRSPANRDVTERTLAGYIMADYDADLGNMPVRGNIGVRVVKTDVTSNGLRSDLAIIDNGDGTVRLETTGDFETVTIKSSNTRILPSVNAIFEVAPNTLLRVAGYRAMSRPAPSALGAGRTFTIDADNFTSVEEAIGNVRANGSPRLKPLMSWNADAAIEWYPNKDSVLSATLYYKQFNGGFQPVVFDEAFVIDGQTVTVPVTQTRNSPDKSRIYGLELTAATRFSFLPKPLDGLGTKVSYNYADSNFTNEDVRLGDQYDPETETVSPGIIPSAGLSGYSKHVLSAQAYYEIGPVSLQAIYNYRSKYYQDFVGGNSQLRYVGPSETVDFRASLNLMKGVSLRFEALNIFNEPKATYMPVYGSSRQYHYYGAKYFVGIRALI